MFALNAASIPTRKARNKKSKGRKCRQARCYFVQGLLGSCLDLSDRLILDRMGHVDRIEVRPSQGSGLSACGQSKFVRSNGNCGNTQILEPNCVVQTARCARPSIGQSLDHGIEIP